MNNKKTAAALLLASLLTFASCSQSPVNSDDGQTAADIQNPEISDVGEVQEEEPEYNPFEALEAVDYEGRNFNMLNRIDCEAEQWVEEYTGEALNDAIFDRNTAVEDKYNTKIVSIPISGDWDARTGFLTAVKKSVQAGDGAYDLINGYAATIGDGFADGLYLNMNTVPNLNLDAEWWSALIRESLTVNGKLFAVTGDIAVNMWDCMQVIYFNKVLLQNYNYTSPYDYVDNGTWTYDLYYSLIEGAEIDADGDGKWTSADRYGALYNDDLAFDNLHNAFGVFFTTHESDGTLTLDVYNEAVIDVANKAYNLAWNNTGVYYANAQWESVKNMFMADQGLFFTSTLSAAQGMREMESDFGIIPYPKANEQQEKYYTTSRDGRSMFVIPIDVPDAAFSGMITEALAIAGKLNVIPVYYDKVLKHKAARDEESGRMLDILRDGLVLDFAAEYAVQTSRPGFIIRDCVYQQKDIASFYAANQKIFEKSFEKFMKNAYYKD